MILGWVTLGIAGCTASLPTLASMLVPRSRIERSLSDTLGAPVQLRTFSLGWIHGVSIDGLTIGQPAGFGDARPLLQMERARLRVGWLSALGTRIDVAGEVQGVQLRVVQKADGRVNLAALGGPTVSVDIADPTETRRRERTPPAAPDEGTDQVASLLRRLRADLALRDVAIDVVHETKGTLDSIRRLQATIDKRFGSTDFDLDLGAELIALQPGKPDGKLSLSADIDGALQRPIDMQLTATGLDFSRYRTLLDATLGPGQLTAFDGVMDGTVKLRIENRRTVRVQGGVTIDRPRLAGTLLQGMDIGASRFVINPNLAVALDAAGGLPQADLGGLSIDLDVAKLTGMATEAAREVFGGQPALGFDFAVDLQRLGKFGGPLPALLAGQPGTVKGRAVLQMGADLFDRLEKASGSLDSLLAFVSANVALDATVQMPTFGFAGGSALANLDLATSLRNGKLSAALGPGATLNGGALTLRAGVDLSAPTWPMNADVGVDGGTLAADALRLVQYAVPLFAGIAEQAGAQVQGKGVLSLSLIGPGRQTDGSTLHWLNRWSGGGKLALTQGHVRPAAQFATLMQWLEPESQGLLRFDDLATDFTLRQGGVETALLKLDRKAKTLALRGRTGLDGKLDHRIDVASLLRGHQDGDKVLAYLRGQTLDAALQGSLLAPQLAMPDLQRLLTEAAKSTAEQELRKGAESLLQKGLQELFKKKK